MQVDVHPLPQPQESTALQGFLNPLMHLVINIFYVLNFQGGKRSVEEKMDLS